VTQTRHIAIENLQQSDFYKIAPVNAAQMKVAMKFNS
jgi:hypothetical protein